MSESSSCLIESNVFFHELSVSELDALDELLLPPTVEPIANAGFPPQVWSKFPGLLLEKILRFLVVRINHHEKIEAEPSFDVFRTRGREASFGRALDPAGLEKELDGRLEF